MNSTTYTFDRRSYLRAAGAVTLGTAGLAGCIGTARGTLATHVTDQPADIGDFESLIVTIEGIWLGPESAESGADDEGMVDDENAEGDDDGRDGGDGQGDADGQGDGDAEGDDDEEDADATDEEDEEDGDATDEGDEEDGENGGPSGREYYEFDEPQRADLVQLQGDEVDLVDERELEVRSYRFLQLDVADEVDATLTDGGEAEVTTPGNAPLTFNAEFEIREDARTNFTADFAPVKRGRTDSYVLRPVPSGIEVTYEDVDGQ